MTRSTVPPPHDPGDPFHRGEQMLQRRFGARERLAGSKAIRPEMPPGFRQFLAGLDYLVLGVPDEAGRPWVTILSGTAGFACVTNETHLHIAALPACDDRVRADLNVGASVAILAIDLARRARVRINGGIVAVAADGITVEVRQAFGNCPQYIWPRKPDAAGELVGSTGEIDLDDPVAQRIIASADTFFIASRFDGEDGATDMDVSHRGGPRGFVRRDGGDLIWPDYRGNFYFNTLGNLLLDPACGLLFPDFESGETLMLTGGGSLEGFNGGIRPTADGLACLGIVRFKPARIIHGQPASRWHRTGAPAILPAF